MCIIKDVIFFIIAFQLILYNDKTTEQGKKIDWMNFKYNKKYSDYIKTTTAKGEVE